MSNKRYTRTRPRTRARGTAATHGCTTDYQRQAHDLLVRAEGLTDADLEAHNLERQFRELGRRWSKSIRQTGGCDCGSPLFVWELGEGTVTVRPTHAATCHAAEGRPTSQLPDGTPLLPPYD